MKFLCDCDKTAVCYSNFMSFYMHWGGNATDLYGYLFCSSSALLTVTMSLTKAAAALQFNACDFFGTKAKPFNLLPSQTQRRSKPANAIFFFFFIVFSHYYKNAVSRVNGPVGMELWLGMYIFNLVGLQLCFFMLSRFLFEATSSGSTSECPHGKRQNPKQKDSKEGIVSLGSCS